MDVKIKQDLLTQYLNCPYYMYDGKFGKQNSGSVELGRSGLLAYGRPAERLLAVPGPFTSVYKNCTKLTKQLHYWQNLD